MPALTGLQNQNHYVPNTVIGLPADLLAFEAPYVEERCLRKGIALSADDFEMLFAELKKYMWLVAHDCEDMQMWSARVDGVWHEFILFTKQYQNFCQRFFGTFIHHTPNTGTMLSDRPSRDYFLASYEKSFGLPPKVWSEGDFATCGSNGC